MEARIAPLESDVAHLRTDMADVKVDVRSLRDKIDATGAKLSENIDGAKIWVLALYITLAAATLGTMAREFEWI